MSREKYLAQVCTRVTLDAADELDRFVRDRMRESGEPSSRALVVRELIEGWARERARARGS